MRKKRNGDGQLIDVTAAGREQLSNALSGLAEAEFFVELGAEPQILPRDREGLRYSTKDRLGDALLEVHRLLRDEVSIYPDGQVGTKRGRVKIFFGPDLPAVMGDRGDFPDLLRSAFWSIATDPSRVAISVPEAHLWFKFEATSGAAEPKANQERHKEVARDAERCDNVEQGHVCLIERHDFVPEELKQREVAIQAAMGVFQAAVAGIDAERRKLAAEFQEHFNALATSLPTATYEDKKIAVKLLNEQLRSRGFAVKCPQSKVPSFLLARPGNRPMIGRFQFVHPEQGKTVVTASRIELPIFEIVVAAQEEQIKTWAGRTGIHSKMDNEGRE